MNISRINEIKRETCSSKEEKISIHFTNIGKGGKIVWKDKAERKLKVHRSAKFLQK